MRTWFDPSPALREFVRGYLYEHPGETSRRPILPMLETRLAFFPGAACRVFDHRLRAIDVLAHAAVIGPQTRRWVDLQPSRQLSGVFAVFRPGGFHRLFGHDASALADHAYPAADVIGPEITGVLERVETEARFEEMTRVVETYLTARLAGARELHPVDRAAHALAAAHGGIRAWTLAEHAGLGDRHFRRRFAEHTGMPPKHYAKVARFMFAVSLKTSRPSLSWTDVSQQAGYFDQMHLVKDFKALTAAPPSALLDQLVLCGFQPSDLEDPVLLAAGVPGPLVEAAGLSVA